MRFAVVNLGCKVNRVDSDTLAAALLGLGHEFVPAPDADAVLINTCTVTGEAEKKTRKAIRHALRENAQATVFVTGCAAVIDPEGLAAISGRVVVEPDKLKAVALMDGRYAIDFEQTLRTGTGFPTRVGIKVQDGCDNACSYCIVNKARGAATSRAFNDVTAEVERYAQAGARELVLTGINLGSYHDGENGLLQLLERLLEQTGEARLRLSSIEPCDVDVRLARLIAQAQGRICRHLHLPLQSGSAKVLKEMNRPYNAQEYFQTVEMLSQEIPGLSLSTDIIVGFPGETEEDFEATLEAARRCAFSKIHVFPYSMRKGTPAAARLDQVPPHIKASRSARLIDLAKQLREADFNARCGQIELVLVERAGRGLTESYYHIPTPLEIPAGVLVPLEIKRAVDMPGAFIAENGEVITDNMLDAMAERHLSGNWDEAAIGKAIRGKPNILRTKTGM